MFYRTRVIANWIFTLQEYGFSTFFCSCDLVLDPMTFIHELDLYCMEIYRTCRYELPKSRLSKVIVWQTDRQTDTTAVIYHAASWVVNNISLLWGVLENRRSHHSHAMYSRISTASRFCPCIPLSDTGMSSPADPTRWPTHDHAKSW